MRDVALFGTGSALIVEYEETCRRRGAFVIAAVTNRYGRSFASVGVPVVDVDALPAAIRDVPCLCPIFTPSLRRIACAEAAAAGFRFAPALIDPTATIAASSTVGDGSFVNAGCAIGAFARIGEHVIVNRNASIGHHAAIGDFVSLGPGANLCGDVTVGSGVTIGAGATVLPAVKIGHDAVVAAGSVVVADVPPGARVFGNPAKVRARVEGGAPATQTSPDEEVVPVVSVAMKSYNHAPYVAAAIQSVLDQTFADFELVVTDDGSTDRTPEIIASFDDPRIRFGRFAENRGISAAMNATVARARGEFVAILNSDDIALPKRLERQLAFLRAHPEVAAVFDVPQQIGEDGEPASGLAGLFDVPFAHRRPSRSEWLRRLFFHGNSLCAPSAMIRRSVYMELGSDDPRLALLMDLDRWVRLLEHHEIAVLAEGLTRFRIRAGQANASSASDENTLRDRVESFQVFKRLREFRPELLRSIFAPDIAAHGIDVTRPVGVWLSQVALLGTAVWHPLFALESLYGSATEPTDLALLRDLAGRVNAFRLDLPGRDIPDSLVDTADARR